MKCRNCGAELKNGMNYCHNCGEEVKIVCPSCAYENEAGRGYCQNCGWPLVEENYSYEEEAPAKKRIPYIISGIIILFALFCIGVVILFFRPTSESEPMTVTSKSSPAESNETITEETENLPTYSASMMNEWYYYDYNMRENYTASSSSVAPGVEAKTYYPDDAIDNDSKSTWMEGADGVGIGEWIALTNTASTDRIISKISFLNGNADTDETFNQNSTPTELELSLGKDVGSAKKLANLKLITTADPQIITLPEPVTIAPGESLIFTIEDVARGNSDTTCISDIRLE